MIVRIDPYRVLVDVAVALERFPSLPTVARLLDPLVHRVDEVDVRRRHANLAEIHRSTVLVASELPVFPAIHRAPYAAPLRVRQERIVFCQRFPRGAVLVCEGALAVSRDLDLSVDDVGVGRRGRERDAPHGTVGKAVPLDTGPIVTAVV